MTRKTTPKTFEDALARLEAITEAMQGSSLPLEEALAAYQEGSELVRFCQNKLAQVEQKLQVLDADGLKELDLDGKE
ncbi:exodeoxyribonuclease VII small subunit [Kingella sp. SNUBH-2017]|jgi:exodeoxyribonuclease VII, small subunit|uniref:Exodeoxyribonuclease 7 small subunit n=1 Tax=Kingella pumchi TaxID=2779506 RepID=A0ABS9NPX8_9NEIS|nr:MULTISPECIES: exodeoxyribonuclease VII small subunit [Kingella]MCG6504852.1 exodeoxyribonuclease VII small subunit [Kingella pumchi]MDD2183175.1 exodeoxyribonuclease VII small subunit [Kingella sp. SNUBH-2017]